MESIFFRKDYDAPIEKRVSNTTIQSGMGFAFFSAVLLMLVTILPFRGSHYALDYAFASRWIPLIMMGLPGYLAFAAGLLAFVFNYIGKHGWAAICGGASLCVWLGYFIFKTLETFFTPEYPSGFRYDRLFGYWVFPIVAALVLYSSLRLHKKEKK